ncbi:MAG: hypothetical protein QXF88_00515 [Candidatus Aenigmatarchaeota archaeon]
MFLGRKGLGAMLTLIIIFTIISIAMFFFVSTFTYNIRFKRVQLITKSQESLIPLAALSSDYSYGDNFLMSFENERQDTIEEFRNKIITYKNYNTLPASSTGTVKNVHYYFYFDGSSATIEYLTNKKCLKQKPEECKEYSFRTTLPLPRVFDGNSFVSEMIFTSFV